MKRDQTHRKKILTGTNNPLLNINKVINPILKESDDLPLDVRQMLVQARDATWKAFAESQEKVRTHYDKGLKG